MQVLFARCSPITSSCTLTSLQYQLHHFRLHLCSLIRNTQQASAPHFFKDPLFYFKNAPQPEPGRKQAPPKTYVFYFLFRPLAGWLRYQLHPSASLFFVSKWFQTQPLSLNHPAQRTCWCTSAWKPEERIPGTHGYHAAGRSPGEGALFQAPNHLPIFPNFLVKSQSLLRSNQLTYTFISCRRLPRTCWMELV